jgi:asparagine synthase (glutamine-hydrolysing)
MCGVAGILDHTGRRVEEHALALMGKRMASRGPDGERIWLGEGVGLIHRRLKIIDLTPAADCPMTNEDGSLVLVFNGEIYNFRKLRRELQLLGHQFRSQGDAETILHGYESWGLEVLKRLDGMFAFGLWDSKRDELILARDRLGEKPLYIGQNQAKTFFASSVMAIVEGLGFTPQINLDALDCYLSHSIIPSTHTIFEGIEPLPAATFRIISPNGNMQQHSYWALPVDRQKSQSAEEAESLIEDEIIQSVESRLVSDVPLGALLSGGVDSSLVVAIASQKKEKLRTYTIGFAEATHDERPHARAVAERIGSVHEEYELGVRDLLDVLPNLVWEYGQPFADSSAIPTHLVQRLAKKDVTVVLTGDGGDEAFGGYWRALAGHYAQIYRRFVPSVLTQGMLAPTFKFIGKWGAPQLTARWERLDWLASSTPEERYTNSLSWFERRTTIAGEALQTVVERHSPEKCFMAHAGDHKSGSIVEQMMRGDYSTQLVDDYLVKVDVAGMATGMEARAPLLAPNLVELAWRMPDNLKVKWGANKWLLKKIAAKYLPHEVIYRPKQGFAMPLRQWWTGVLGNLLEDLLTDSRAVSLGWICEKPVRQALEQHRAWKEDHSTRLWLILWLELWIRICLERSLSPSSQIS